MQSVSIPANSSVYKTGSFLILAGAVPVADAVFLMYSGAMQTAFALPVAFMLVAGSYGIVAGLADWVKWLRARTTPALLLTKDGISDATGIITGGDLLWTEIRGVAKVREQGQVLLAIYLHDDSSYLSRLPLWKRLLLSQNIKRCGTPFLVSGSELAMTVEETLVALRNAQQIVTEANLSRTTPQSPRHWWTAVPPEERGVVALGNGR